MSGIVRGFMRPSALFDLRTGTFGEITAYSEEHAEEVRVVPLDDATLAGMAETMARIEFDAASQQRIATWSWETLPETYKRTFLEHEVRKIRAALGLEGGA